MAMEKERMAIGVRRPGRPEIEYAVMRNGVGDRLMPILEDRYVRNPNRVFADMIPNQRLMEAKNGMEFLDGARKARVQRWVVHQLDQWDDGLVKPKNPVSLRARWHQYVAAHGAERFVPLNTGLSRIGKDGIQRHCVMGMALELFLDDYPASIVPSRGLPPMRDALVIYKNLETPNYDFVTIGLPDVVVRELGLQNTGGSFQLTPSVIRVMGRYYGTASEQVGQVLKDAHQNACLVALNDRTGNWPMLAAIMEEPSAEVFRRT